MPAIGRRMQFEPTKRASKNYIQKTVQSCNRGGKAYCLRSSTSLAVRLAISPMERRMSSLSLGSSHRSAMRLASASRALMFSSPSGPPWGLANQAYKTHKYSLVYLMTSRCSREHKREKREEEEVRFSGRG